MIKTAALNTNFSSAPLVCRPCALSGFCYSAEKCAQPNQLKPFQLKTMLNPRQMLCNKNEKLHSFYLVKSGVLKVSSIDTDGMEHINHFYFPGEIIGFEALHQQTYPYSITAVKRAELCEIPANYILQLAALNPLLQTTFLQLISQRLNLHKNIANFTAEQRVASFLLDLERRLSFKSQQAFILPLSRELIGRYLGLATETISRILMRFHRANYIEVQRQQIKILDLKKLEEC